MLWMHTRSWWSQIRVYHRCEQWESSFILLPPCKHIPSTWNKRLCQCHVFTIWRLFAWWTAKKDVPSNIRLRYPVPGTTLTGTGAGTGYAVHPYLAVTLSRFSGSARNFFGSVADWRHKIMKGGSHFETSFSRKRTSRRHLARAGFKPD